jgi:hypothetical protein
MFPPERIVCLTEETVETLYLLGEDRRIVGISGYVVRPARARREKPRVSAFTSADIPKILASAMAFCVPENSQDPLQPIRPIIGRTTAVAFIARATGAYDAPVKKRGTGRSLTRAIG